MEVSDEICVCEEDDLKAHLAKHAKEPESQKSKVYKGDREKRDGDIAVAASSPR